MGMARIGAGAGFEEGKTLYTGDNLFSFIFHPVTAVGKSGPADDSEETYVDLQRYGF